MSFVSPTPQQVRAARGWLGWSRQQLAQQARVGEATIKRYELESHTVSIETVRRLCGALERAGVQFAGAEWLGRPERAENRA